MTGQPSIHHTHSHRHASTYVDTPTNTSTLARTECDKIIDSVFAIASNVKHTANWTMPVDLQCVRVSECECVCVIRLMLCGTCVIASPQFNIVKTTSNIVQMRLHNINWREPTIESERTQSFQGERVCQCVCARVFVCIRVWKITEIIENWLQKSWRKYVVKIASMKKLANKLARSVARCL